MYSGQAAQLPPRILPLHSTTASPTRHDSNGQSGAAGVDDGRGQLLQWPTATYQHYHSSNVQRQRQSTAAAAAAAGIPWGALAATVPGGDADAPSPSPPRQHAADHALLPFGRSSPRTDAEGGWSDGRGDGPRGRRDTGIRILHADECLSPSPSPQQRPDLSSFAFSFPHRGREAAAVNVGDGAHCAVPGGRSSTGSHTNISTATGSAAAATTGNAANASVLSSFAGPMIRRPSATVAYYALAAQPYSGVAAAQRDEAAVGRNAQPPHRDGHEDDDDDSVELEVEELPRHGPQASPHRRGKEDSTAPRRAAQAGRTQRMGPTRAVPSSPSTTAATPSTVPVASSLPSSRTTSRSSRRRRPLHDDYTSGEWDDEEEERRRRLRSRSRSSNRRGHGSAPPDAGRPLYPHLKEQQRLHTTGLVRSPSAASAALSNRSVSVPSRSSSSNSSTGRRGVASHGAGAGPQPRRSAVWLSRLLEDAVRQFTAQRGAVAGRYGVDPKTLRAMFRGSARAAAGGDTGALAGGEGGAGAAPHLSLSVADRFTHFLTARYGSAHWRPLLEEAAAAMQRFHTVAPLVAVFRRYFAPAVATQASEEQNRTNFDLFCRVKELLAAGSFTVQGRVDFPWDGEASMPAVGSTMALRRYLRLHDAEAVLTSALERVVIREAVVVPVGGRSALAVALGAEAAVSAGDAQEQKTASEQKSPFLFVKAPPQSMLSPPPGDAAAAAAVSVVVLRRHLRGTEVRTVLEQLRAWMEAGHPQERHDDVNAAAFDRVGCVDADAAAQAVVEALNVTCCLHAGEAVARQRSSASGTRHNGPSEYVSASARADTVDAAAAGQHGRRTPAPSMAAPEQLHDARADGAAEAENEPDEGGTADTEHGAAAAESDELLQTSERSAEEPDGSHESDYDARLARFNNLLRANMLRRGAPVMGRKEDATGFHAAEENGSSQPVTHQSVADDSEHDGPASTDAAHGLPTATPQSAAAVAAPPAPAAARSPPPSRRSSTPTPSRLEWERQTPQRTTCPPHESHDGDPALGDSARGPTQSSNARLIYARERHSEPGEAARGPREVGRGGAGIPENGRAPEEAAETPRERLRTTLAALAADLQERRRIREQQQQREEWAAQPWRQGYEEAPPTQPVVETWAAASTAGGPAPIPATARRDPALQAKEEAEALADLDAVLNRIKARRSGGTL